MLSETKQQVLSALPEFGGDPIPFREVHRLVDCWAPSHIRKLLADLEYEGYVASVLVPHRRNGDTIRLFKRSAQLAEAAE